MKAFLIIFVSSLWVLLDSREIGVKKGQVDKLGNLGPWGWFFSSLFLWIITFPFYLFKRNKFKEINKKHIDDKTSGEKFMKIASNVIFLITIFFIFIIL